MKRNFGLFLVSLLLSLSIIGPAPAQIVYNSKIIHNMEYADAYNSIMSNLLMNYWNGSVSYEGKESGFWEGDWMGDAHIRGIDNLAAIAFDPRFLPDQSELNRADTRTDLLRKANRTIDYTTWVLTSKVPAALAAFQATNELHGITKGELYSVVSGGLGYSAGFEMSSAPDYEKYAPLAYRGISVRPRYKLLARQYADIILNVFSNQALVEGLQYETNFSTGQALSTNAWAILRLIKNDTYEENYAADIKRAMQFVERMEATPSNFAEVVKAYLMLADITGDSAYREKAFAIGDDVARQVENYQKQAKDGTAGSHGYYMSTHLNYIDMFLTLYDVSPRKKYLILSKSGIDTIIEYFLIDDPLNNGYKTVAHDTNFANFVRSDRWPPDPSKMGAQPPHLTKAYPACTGCVHLFCHLLYRYDLLKNKIVIRKVEIDIDPADWDTIRHTARKAEVTIPVCGDGPAESPFEYVPATVTVDGQTLTNVGVRTKGFLGSINPARPSLKFKFDKFVDDQLLGDIERMTLNNNHQDPSRMQTCFAYKTFQKAGLPAPDCNFAHVSVNGMDLGIYSDVEAIKKRFLRKHFDDDEGNLYEAQLSDFTTEDINRWERKTNTKSDDRSDLENVMAALAADDATLLSRLEPLVDLDKFYSFWAMEVLTAHWDGYNGNMNNCYIYNDPTTGKFVFIPWGTDSSFSPESETLNLNSVGPLFANSALSNRLYHHPLARQKFIERLAALYEMVWGDGHLQAEVGRIQEALQPLISSAYNPNFASAAADLKAFMNSHAAAVYNTLIARPTPPAYPYAPQSRCIDALPDPVPFSISFSTTWGIGGTLNGEFSEFNIPGVDFIQTLNYVYGALVGPGEAETFGVGNIGMVFYQVRTPLRMTRQTTGIILRLSEQQFMSGEPIVIENAAAGALQFSSTSLTDTDAALVDGVVTNGVLTLNRYGMTSGDIVSGTFSGEIVYIPGLLGKAKVLQLPLQ